MGEARMVGIGRIVLRTREHLAAIRPKDGVIVLETLYHGDEIRNARELLPAGAAGAEPTAREIVMATQLIELLRADWDPGRYTDRGRERLLEAIAAKAKDGGTVTQPDVEPAADVTDLMDALRASVEAAKARAEEQRAG
jgi:DNA end-binding protein Ku